MQAAETIWTERDTTPEAISAALRGLLAEKHTQTGGIAPARVLNMVAFVERAWGGEIANRMRGVGRFHASRMIELSFDPNRETLDARAIIAAEERTNARIALLRESIVIAIGPRHLDDLLTITDPLLISDIPTLLWSPHGHPEVIDALVPLADSVLIDSVDEPDCNEAIERACALRRKAYVIDLAWLRAGRWRERTAAAFDPPQHRRELQTITSVEICHHPASTVVAMLFVGWLASRLHWRVDTLTGYGDTLTGNAAAHRQDVLVTLRTRREQEHRGISRVSFQTASGRSISFQSDAAGVRTCRATRDGAARQWTILGAPLNESETLGEGIRQTLLRDPTYAPALLAAHAMAR